MRLEHKSAYLDLPELQQRSKTPTQDQVIQLTLTPTTHTTTNQDVTDHSGQYQQHEQTTQQQQFKTLTINNEEQKLKNGFTQTPPPVPPKPHPPVMATIVPTQYDIPNNISSMTSTQMNSSLDSTEKKSSSFEYFKKIDEVIKDQPLDTNYQKYEMKQTASLQPLEVKRPLVNLEEELKNLNLIPGSPPEICYIPKSEQQTKPPMINEKIKIIEETQSFAKEPPQGGINTLPPISSSGPPPSSHNNLPLASETYTHDSTLTKSVKIEYGQPIIRPAGTLPTPAQQFTRSPSPKPSAEGLAMSKLWTPNHVSGYESCTTSDFEHTENKTTQKSDFKIQKLPTPTQELSAPFLVKQATKSIPIPSTTRPKTPIDDIDLKPGTPPEICFAPKPEQRRQSLVETMEKTIEQNLIQSGPSRVLPYSVPTITPNGITKPVYKPPPPVMPSKLQTPLQQRGEYYESDYESDRWKYSGSESDENSLRNPVKPYQAPFKTNGYAADTEEISSFNKMESSSMEKKSYFESSSNSGPQMAAPTHMQMPAMAPMPSMERPAQLYFTSTPQDKQESFSSNENKYHHEDKVRLKKILKKYNQKT